jgi:UDP-galactopyranose mutase
MMRLARHRPVMFIEEPVFGGVPRPQLKRRRLADADLTILTPSLPDPLSGATADEPIRRLLQGVIAEIPPPGPLLWFYTPMALPLVDPRRGQLRIYDCMDELSSFDGAPAMLRSREEELLRCADIVFTGGMSLYEAKRELHANVHAFPSAVDFGHFASARSDLPDPADQAALPSPRFGFFGVLDERLDRALIAAVAALRPDWHFVFVGPVAKIDPESLPRAANIHYLGAKPYRELPSYVAHWDVAIMPFARNAATRFISPTKTPEYLSSGRLVVSTPIADVVRSWGHLEAVKIAGDAATFAAECAAALALSQHAGRWRDDADRDLAAISWDSTVARMEALIAEEAARLSTKRSAATSLNRSPSAQSKGEARV